MTVKSRADLMRHLSGLPDGPLVEDDTVVAALGTEGMPVIALLLCFAAEVCGTEAKGLSAEDLMRHLAATGRGR